MRSPHKSNRERTIPAAGLLLVLLAAANGAAYAYLYGHETSLQERISGALWLASTRSGIWQIYNTPHYLASALLPVALAATASISIALAWRARIWEKKAHWLLVAALLAAVYYATGYSLEGTDIQFLWAPAGMAASLALAQKLRERPAAKTLLYGGMLLALAGDRSNPFWTFAAGSALAVLAQECLPPAWHMLESRIKNINIRPNLILAGIVLLSLGLRLWGLMDNQGFKNTYVEGAVLYAAASMEDGLVPFRDFVQTHLPLLPYTLLLFGKISGIGIVQGRVLNAAIITLAMLPLYAITRRLYGTRAALYACLFWALHPAVISAGRVVVREPLMVLLSLTSIALFQRRQDTKSALSAGILLGAATLAKETALLALPLFFLLAKRRKELVPVLAGLSIALIPVAAFYLAGPENFRFMLEYHQNALQQAPYERVMGMARELGTGNLATSGLLLIGAVSAARGRDRLALAWLLTASAVLLNRMFIWHYALQVTPPLVILMAKGMEKLRELFPKQSATGSLGVALLAMVLAASMAFPLDPENRIKDDMTPRTAEALAKVTTENDLVVSSMLEVPLLADRKVPGELYEFGYQNRVHNASEINKVLKEKKVRAIVLDHRTSPPAEYDNLEGLREYVYANYQKAATVPSEGGNAEIWVLKGGDTD